MPTSSRTIGVLTVLCLLAAWRAPATVEIGQKPRTDRLERLAAEAKRKGETTATFDISWEYAGLADGPDEFFSRYSLVVARPIDGRRTTTADQSYINSWVAVRVTRTISLIPREPAACWRESAPSALQLAGPDEYAVSMTGGTLVVDGVAITQTGTQPRPNLTAGNEYLLVVAACPGHVMNLQYGGFSVFEVDQGGRLKTDHGFSAPPFISAILSLGTVDAVAARYKKR